MFDMEERIHHLDALMAELAHSQLKSEVEMKEMRRQAQQQAERLEAMQDRREADRRRFEEAMEAMQDRREADRRRLEQSMDGLMQRMEANTEKMEAERREQREHSRKLEEEWIAERRRANKQWGDLANKMGTVAEDVVAPNIPRLAEEAFGFREVEDLLVRARRSSRRGEKRRAEWDVVCSGPEKVLVVEVKSSPTVEKIEAVPGRLKEFFDFFPEYEGRELIGVFGSWSIEAGLLPVISRAGLYGIAMGDETMDIVARPAGA